MMNRAAIQESVFTGTITFYVEIVKLEVRVDFKRCVDDEYGVQGVFLFAVFAVPWISTT